MLVSALIGIFVDIALPYAFHDFHFQYLGAFAAALYFGSIAYSITALRLFDIRVVIKRTFIFTALVGIGLEVYELALEWLARLLPVSNGTDRHFLATMLVLLVNVCTQDMGKAWLNSALNLDARQRLKGKEPLMQRS